MLRDSRVLVKTLSPGRAASQAERRLVLEGPIEEPALMAKHEFLLDETPIRTRFPGHLADEFRGDRELPLGTYRVSARKQDRAGETVYELPSIEIDAGHLEDGLAIIQLPDIPGAAIDEFWG